MLSQAMLLLLSTLLLGSPHAPDPVRVEITWDGTTCGYRVDGAQVSQEELDRRAPAWVREKRAIALTGERDTPYRCIGGTIFRLQAAGTLRVAFVSEPPPARVDLFVPGGRCRVRLDGDWVTFDLLRQRAAAWKQVQPEIHFKPSRAAEYQCVDRVLSILREFSVVKLGFVMNMRAPEPEPLP
jgi:biopolymer transport protein ExbD